jgi:hypothetical protein
MFRHAKIYISWPIDCVDMDRAAQRATDVMGLCQNSVRGPGVLQAAPYRREPAWQPLDS